MHHYACSQALVPSMSTFEGAVMVADISGFTQLTEQLSRRAHSSAGVELLTKCINNFFSKVGNSHALRCAALGWAVLCGAVLESSRRLSIAEMV